jgi:hypothetical protein
VLPKLPPPDPHESLDPPAGLQLDAPTAVFVGGGATTDANRAADRFLELRPGLLLVVAAPG